METGSHPVGIRRKIAMNHQHVSSPYPHLFMVVHHPVLSMSDEHLMSTAGFDHFIFPFLFKFASTLICLMLALLHPHQEAVC